MELRLRRESLEPRAAEPARQVASQPAKPVRQAASQPVSRPNERKDPAHTEQHYAAPSEQLQPETHPVPSSVASGDTHNTAGKAPSNTQLN